ncbi:uncharacterized protein E0L32_004057 [Thyridium curvatum]|uniref:Uncharacterized protein n=1 Tax=Thyridium curvatum TaxID=1093900 RepID=A0A507BIB9_9PEZI|nr:uncharacterized protein E0L32_004057 [Thyridium curvatum]TPX16408.1 hypothetical protein E0L32_004057 [Thyridium curvatum]
MIGILEKAREVSREYSKAQPFTNLDMFEALLHRRGSLAAFVQDPASLKKLCPVLRTDADATSFLERTPAGTCTVNIIHWADRLQEKYPDEFEFLFFNTGNHWVALCPKSMVLLDSISKFGAVRLEKDAPCHWIASEEAQNPGSQRLEWGWDGKELTVTNRRGKERANDQADYITSASIDGISVAFCGQ